MLEIGDRLPARPLSRPDGPAAAAPDRPVPLRDGSPHPGTVLFWAHASPCPDCAAYLEELLAVLRGELTPPGWWLRLVVIVPAGRGEASGRGVSRGQAPRRGGETETLRTANDGLPTLAAGDGLPTLAADPDGGARAACGIPEGTAALHVADRRGRIYHARAAERAGDLTAPADVVDEVRFVATQCPECGVPDDPPATMGWRPLG